MQTLCTTCICSCNNSAIALHPTSCIMWAVAICGHVHEMQLPHSDRALDYGTYAPAQVGGPAGVRAAEHMAMTLQPGAGLRMLCRPRAIVV